MPKVFAESTAFTIIPQSIYTSDQHAYSYAPSIIQEGETIHIFFCSVPKDEKGIVGDGAWDYIRHTKSEDQGKTWNSPVIVIKSKMNMEGVDRSACDPSVVYYKGYYYMYYGSVYRTGYIREVPQYYTHIQVARSENIEGPYMTYTMRNTWEVLPNDPKPIIYPYYKSPDLTTTPLLGEQSLGYGAGQPTVVVKDDKIYLWYLDTSKFDKKEVSSSQLLMMVSDNPVEWGGLSEDGKTWTPHNGQLLTGVEKFGIGEIRYNELNSTFSSIVIHDNHNLSSSLWITESTDGIEWSKGRELLTSVEFSNFAHNIGMEGDARGFISKKTLLISYGSPQDTEAQYDSWGKWDLTGMFVNIDVQTEPDLSLGISSEKYLQELLKKKIPLKESEMTKLYDTNYFLNSEVFDWKYYTMSNPDLTSMNEEQARFHWRNYGSLEGRKAHPDFFAKFYILSNPILAKVLHWNAFDTSTYARALQHFLFSGKEFGKKGTLEEYISLSGLLDSQVFDWEFYTRKPKYETFYLAHPEIASRNKDLGLMNEEQAKNHWIHYGLYEGRPSSPTFWITSYVKEHPELKNELGSDVSDYVKYVTHYIEHRLP